MDLLERVEAQASHRRLRRCSQPQTFCQNSRLRSKLQRQPDLRIPIEECLEPWRLTSQIPIKDGPFFVLALQAHQRALPPTTTISSRALSPSPLLPSMPTDGRRPLIGGRTVFSLRVRLNGAPNHQRERSESFFFRGRKLSALARSVDHFPPSVNPAVSGSRVESWGFGRSFSPSEPGC
ncbi:hypothetical protein SCHPADRAFT_90343 [Schizopora paradoxa]|uniref:Uncharacterized protein n=1 Tax=Schizopora paradoxa TaxID=27342 RepID=A0A0H2SBJ9_9AGAM|nr:hypothetical protein SCHPADRAFT_90343 [Schizopora paradoxa]